MKNKSPKTDKSVSENIVGKIKDEAEKKALKLDEKGTRVFLDPSSPSNWAVVRVVLITLLFLYLLSFVATLIVSLTHLFFMIVLAIFFAYLIDPLVEVIRRPFIERNRDSIMPRPLAIAIAYLLIFTVIGVAIASLTPKVVNQAEQFAANFPGYIASVQERINNFNDQYIKYRLPQAIQDSANVRMKEFIEEFGKTSTSFAGAIALAVVTYIPWVILVPVLSFFFLKDANLFRVSILKIVPSGSWRDRIESVIADFNKTLAAYTRAQLTSCVFIGTICTIGFYLIGLDYALLLGILAGILEFIPLIGPLMIALTATLVGGFSDNPWHALYVIIFLAVLRIVQDYFLYPRIVRGGIHLHPLAIILSVLAGEQIAGIPGVFLSIPVVALLTVLYKHILEHSGSKGLLTGMLAPAANKTAQMPAAEPLEKPQI